MALFGPEATGGMSEEERRDRLAHSLQTMPEECTAEAAASRKWPAPPGVTVSSSYVADLNGYRVTQDMLRHPSGPHWSELVHVGSVVRTNYSTGPYIVQEIYEYEHYGVRLICLTMKPGKAYLNDYVAVDGQLLALFLSNNDEIVIEGEAVIVGQQAVLV